MGSSGALVCSTAFLLFLMSSACKDDEACLQRPVTFGFDEIMQEIQQPEQFMMQSEVDLSELLDPKEFPVEQVMMSPQEPYDTLRDRGSSRPGILTPRGRQPSFMPRSFGGPPLLQYPVKFPLGRPTPDNIQAICLHGDHRPKYPDSYFPSSGFGQQRRRASAVNKAEAWFKMCCKGNQTWETGVTLCCATQAWELSIQKFCEEDSSVKDVLYRCCRLSGSERLDCFHNDAPNPNYEPMLELQVPVLPSVSFNFDPNTCQRTVVAPYSVRGNKKKKMKKPSTSKTADINFPPGRPTLEVLEPLCKNQKLRSLYNIKCLQGSGYEFLARQAKTINRIEKAFKKCCKKQKHVLDCVDGKWTDELDRFCSGENGEQVDFHCCSQVGEERYSCFESISPDPHFNMTSATVEPSLQSLCDTHKIIKKKFPVGFPLKSFVNQCCLLPEQDKGSCFEQRLKEMSDSLCSSKRPTPPAVRRCCRKPSSQEAPECVANILMDAITKATNFSQQKKKKRCPIS